MVDHSGKIRICIIGWICYNAFPAGPNHVHGILKIDQNDGFECRDAINRVSTLSFSTQKTGGITGNKNPMLHQNISRVIRWYKGRVSSEIHKIDKAFAWQSNYYDRIIRNQKELENIENYIRSNPSEWAEDEYNFR
jgi:REP element-mobilizing transposase RayT